MSAVSEEKKWLEFIPFIENSPINVIKLRELLQTHPDIEFLNYVCNGIRDGFDTMITNADLLTFECRNNFSARSQPAIVKDLIDKECEKGFLSGPYKIPPFKKYRVSPLGLAEWKYSKKKRLILDLSAPHDTYDISSINDLICKEECSLTYVKINDAIKVIRDLGRFSLCSKFDIE